MIKRTDSGIEVPRASTEPSQGIHPPAGYHTMRVAHARAGLAVTISGRDLGVTAM
jgi:hypothetical protein